MRIRENSEQMLPVKYVIQHPNFDPRRPMNYDIALLKLDGAFNFSKAIVIYDLFQWGDVRPLLLLDAVKSLETQFKPISQLSDYTISRGIT